MKTTYILGLHHVETVFIYLSPDTTPIRIVLAILFFSQFVKKLNIPTHFFQFICNCVVD
jgi:hypothetical protein